MSNNKKTGRLKTALTGGGALYGRACLVRYEHPVAFFGVCALLLSWSLVMALGVTSPAHADLATDIQNNLNSMAPWNWANDLINVAFGLVNINSDFLRQSFNAVLGSESGAYDFIEAVNKNVVKPISISILAIIFLVEVARIANDFESRGTMPPFKEIALIWLGCAICIALVNKSFDFCQNIFDMFNALIGSTMDTGTQAAQNNYFANPNGVTVEIQDENNNTLTLTPFIQNCIQDIGGGFILKLLLGLILFIECAIVSIVTYFSLLARGFQVYVYAAISPMMVAFFGSEKTQQWAISFVKSFIALCLAGLIMAICIKLMPLAAAGIARSVGGNIGGFFMIVATYGVYIKAMASAGSWAKEIVGG